MDKETQAVLGFLTDAKHQRQVESRLFELAEERPEAVRSYLDLLPPDWEEELPARMVILLRRLRNRIG